NRPTIPDRQRFQARRRSKTEEPLSMRFRFLLASLFSAVLAAPSASLSHEAQTVSGLEARASQTSPVYRQAPVLGADLSFASNPSPLIEAWQDKQKADQMTAALKEAGVDSLRFLFGGLYSPRSAEATIQIKKENKLDIGYAWFPIDDYVDFIAAHDFTTIVGVNVEEGPDVASVVVKKFLDRGLREKLVAIELSNEPWLNPRPWLPEEFAS